MKHTKRPSQASGVSLLEAVIAISVVAVAVPLALGAMGKAGVVGATARAETRAPGIADWCRVELEAARRGVSEVLPPLPAGQAFPAEGEVLALAFDRDGSLVGPVEAEAYESGLSRLGEEDVYYIASLSGRPEETGVTLTVSVEYPAVRREERRDEVAFHTILP